MKTSFTILDGSAARDFMSVYNPVSHLKEVNFMPGFSWDRCASTPEMVEDEELQSITDKIKSSLLNYDFIVVTGKFSTEETQKDSTLCQWLEICKLRPENGIGVYRFVVTC